jgi:transposase InsO family protein
VRFGFIEAEKARYPVGVLCRMLRVRRSGFYAWRRRPESRRAREDKRLAVEVRAVFEANRRRYGSPRVHAELREAGCSVGRHRVARLLRAHGLQARKRRRFVHTTDSQHALPVAPNLLDRHFEAAAPNQVWVGDVTFLPTLEGWLYLAVLIDLFSRRIVGWSMSDKNDEALTLSALGMAIDQRAPAPGLIHHTDRGTTYAATEYQDVLRRNGIRCSMSRKGNCLDNAVAESLFSTLKTECTARVTFPSRAAARREVFEYIATFYNPTRRHSRIGYKSPIEFERAAGH